MTTQQYSAAIRPEGVNDNDVETVWSEFNPLTGKLTELGIYVSQSAKDILAMYEWLGCSLECEEPLQGANLLTFYVAFHDRRVHSQTVARNARSARLGIERMCKELKTKTWLDLLDSTRTEVLEQDERWREKDDDSSDT